VRSLHVLPVYACVLPVCAWVLSRHSRMVSERPCDGLAYLASPLELSVTLNWIKRV